MSFSEVLCNYLCDFSFNIMKSILNMTINNLDIIIISRVSMIKYNNLSNNKLILNPYQLNV